MTFTPERRRELSVVYGIAALYLLLWFFLPKPSFWGIDNGVKYMGMRAFADHGSIVIPYHGYQLGIDPGHRHIPLPFSIPTAKGQLNSFSPLFEVLGGLFYMLIGPKGPFLLPVIGAIFLLLVCWRLWVNQRDTHDGRVYLLMLGVGSPFLFYSTELWEHSWAAALVVLGFSLIFTPRVQGFKRDDMTGLLRAGLFMGLACGFRPEAILPVMILFFSWRYTGRPITSMMRLGSGIFLGLFLVALVNLWQTGTVFPISMGTNWAVSRSGGMLSAFLTRLQNGYLLTMQGFSSEVISIFALIPVFALIVWSGWRQELEAWMYLGGGMVLATGYYLFNFGITADSVAYSSQTTGLFWVTPIAVLAIQPLRGERRHFWRVMWNCWVVTFFALALISPPLKGVHWGPRVGLIVMPFLLLIASTRMQRWWDKYDHARPMFAILAGLGIVIQLVSAFIQFNGHQYNAKLNRWAVGEPNEIVLTADWWLGGDCALASYDKPWFLVRHLPDMHNVLDILQLKGVEKVSYLESSPYVLEKEWKRIGVQPLKSEVFLEGKTGLRKTPLILIPAEKTTQEASAPGDSLAAARAPAG
jgi:hypothetical protein